MSGGNGTLRIVTYNIHKARGMDGRVRPSRIVDVLAEIRADIIALQEVVNIPHGAPEDHQAEYISRRLGYPFVVGEARKLKGGVYGNVVLSRFAITHWRNFDISVEHAEKRGCLRVDLDLGAPGRVTVFNIHLGTSLIERRVQARKLISSDILTNDDCRGRRIIVGDFNEWTSGLTTRYLASHFKSADIREHMNWTRTYPGFFPFMHLDHVYYDPDLRLVRLGLHRNRLSLIASDHLPLVADFDAPRADQECLRERAATDSPIS
jgi:endonuclease/exonuclease/phosphatase family metal-dependent hydrolase